MVAFLKANPKLKLAVLAGYWASYQNGIATNELGLDGAGAKTPDKARRSFEHGPSDKVGGVDLDKAHESNGTRWLPRGETSLACRSDWEISHLLETLPCHSAWGTVMCW